MECFVCNKHRSGDGIIASDEFMALGHVLPGAPGGPVYLGHLLVEPRRHVSGLADLTEDEAAAMGRWLARGAAALRAEHVYSSVVGHQVDHLHVHLVPRYPGTPREFWWPRLDEWPDAPMGGTADVAERITVLRQRLSAPAP